MFDNFSIYEFCKKLKTTQFSNQLFLNTHDTYKMKIENNILLKNENHIGS